MKTAKLIELERHRLGLMDEARSILAKLETETNEQRAAELCRDHDRVMRQCDVNRLDVEEEALLIKSEEERVAMRPHTGSESTYSNDGLTARTSGWAEAKGAEIRVLAPNQPLFEGRERGPSLGDTLRAMIMGPRNDAERRALAEGTDSAGGFTVPTPLATEFIDKLRAASVVMRAGARTIPMDRETLSFARLATDPTVGWREENAAVPTGDPTFERVQLQARSLMGLVKVSRELVEDSVNISAILEQAFIQSLAVEFDRAILFGSGISPEPAGLFGAAGIGSVSMGANGATPTGYGQILDGIYATQLANASAPTAAIWHPRTALTFAKLVDGNLNPLVEPSMSAAVPKLATTSVPINQTQGTAADQCSTILLGDFRQLMVGMRMTMRIELIRELYAANNQFAFVAGLRGDVAVAQPGAFTKVIGIKA